MQNIQIFACSQFAETGNVNIYLSGYEKGPFPQAISWKKLVGKILYLENTALTNSIYSCWNIVHTMLQMN